MTHPSVSQETSIPDPILSWGSSVNVNEDLRRSIRTEVEGFDADIDSLQAHVKNEDRTSSQLAKDFSHARTEMMELSRTVADEFDSATLKDQVRSRLKATLRSELLMSSPTSIVSLNSATQDNDDVVMDGTTEKNKVDNAQEKKPMTASFLAHRTAELKKVHASFSQELETVREYKAEKADLLRDIQATRSRIESSIVPELEADKQDIMLRREERHQEERRTRNTEEQIQKLNAKSGHHAQQIADRTKELQSKKAAYGKQECEVDLCIENLEAQLECNKSGRKEIESKYRSVSEQLDCLNEQLNAFDAIRAKRASLKEECTKLETEQQPTKAHDEINVQVDDARSKQALTAARLEKSKSLRTAVQAERVANDKVDAEQILSAREEISTLLQEKQKLVESMNTLHEESVSTEEQGNKGLGTQSETLNKLELDKKQVTGDLEEARAANDSTKKSREEFDSKFSNQLKQHQEFRLKFQQAAAAEKERAEELRLDRKELRKERCEEAREASRKMRAEYDAKLEVLRAGHELISTTIELENQ